MSGLELALAILPLMIAAAEHEKHILEKTKCVVSNKTKDSKQLEFYYELFDELSLLASTLDGLFMGLPARTGKIGSPRLNDDEREALNEVLGCRATSFQSILERLLKSLEDIISDKSIDIKSSDVSILFPIPFLIKLEKFKAVVERGDSIGTLTQRLRFTRNEKSRQVAIRKIKENNEKLERLLRGSEGCNRTYKPVNRKARPARLRRFSEPVFTKIADKWSSRCGCDSVHEARLCLWNCCSDHRVSRSMDSRSMDSIDLMVSVSDVEDGMTWQESVILIPLEGEEKQPEKGVRFVTATTSHQSSAHRREVDTDSFCDLVQSAYLRNMALEIVFERGKLWQTRARRKSLAFDKQRDVTLRQLLTDSTRKLSLREQRILAVVLAHAALHCSDGPWLSEQWSKEYISFFKPDYSDQVDVRHPFLKLKFDEKAVEDDNSLFCMHPNPRLLALGILLLEIYLEDTIESRWLETDLSDGLVNENTNLTAAMRLLDASDGKVYEGYRDAIRACLEFEFSDTDGMDLSQRIYEDIVLPLELELEHGFHITPETFNLQCTQVDQH